MFLNFFDQMAPDEPDELKTEHELHENSHF